jgi:hypothetical protein
MKTKTYKVEVDSYDTIRWYNEAVKYPDGFTVWYKNGKQDREDGPAFEYLGGSKVWCKNGEQRTETEFDAKMDPAVEVSIEEIEKMYGHKVKIVKG